MPNIPTDGFETTVSSNEQQDVSLNNSEDGDDEEEELWELKEILTPTDLRTKNPKPCHSDHCSLLACCAWVSNLEPESYWYTCLDCQEADFGGFPPKEELPVGIYLSGENREVILEKCTEFPEVRDYVVVVGVILIVPSSAVCSFMFWSVWSHCRVHLLIDSVLILFLTSFAKKLLLYSNIHFVRRKHNSQISPLNRHCSSPPTTIPQPPSHHPPSSTRQSSPHNPTW